MTYNNDRSGVKLSPLASSGSVVPVSGDGWVWNIGGMMNGRGKLKNLEKNLPHC